MADSVDTMVRAFYDAAFELEATDSATAPSAERARRFDLPREKTGRGPRRRRLGTTPRIALIACVLVIASASAAPALNDPISDAVVKGAANLIEALRENEGAEPIPQATRDLNNLVDGGSHLGVLLNDAGEVLVSASRDHRRAVVSVTPTSAGGICASMALSSAYMEDVAGIHCVAELDRRHPAVLLRMFHPRPNAIGGILHPDVSRIEIDTESGWIDVPVERNAFVWLPPRKHPRIVRVRVTLDDGESVVVE